MKIVVAALASCIAAGCGTVSHPVAFREHQLDQLWDQSSSCQRGYLDVEFSDADAVMDAVFTHLPREAHVYPTDGYYYFQATLRDREVSGNFRIIDDGEAGPSLAFAYFDVDNPRQYHAMQCGPDDQRVRVQREQDGVYCVEYSGERRVFRDASRPFRVQSDAIKLTDSEQFVSGVMDESGILFQLLFNTDSHTFYYLLTPHAEMAEHWIVLEEATEYRVLLGQRSRFIILEDSDTDRWLLVGVSAAEVRRNTYFDGPFDQVPPDLNLAPMLEKAYPYTTRGAGIDMHGSFRDREDTRVAVSPYQPYQTPAEMRKLIQMAYERSGTFDDVHRILCYESKRDFQPDDLKRARRQWPANHFRTVSYSWKEDRDGDR